MVVGEVKHVGGCLLYYSIGIWNVGVEPELQVAALGRQTALSVLEGLATAPSCADVINPVSEISIELTSCYCWDGCVLRQAATCWNPFSEREAEHQHQERRRQNSLS